MQDLKPYPTVPAELEPPGAVTVELRINGRKVKAFPWRQFADRREMTPTEACKVIALWMELTAKSDT